MAGGPTSHLVSRSMHLHSHDRRSNCSPTARCRTVVQQLNAAVGNTFFTKPRMADAQRDAVGGATVGCRRMMYALSSADAATDTTDTEATRRFWRSRNAAAAADS